jgi:hypothetical protein
VTHVALDRRFVAWREEADNAIQRLKDSRLYALSVQSRGFCKSGSIRDARREL